MLFTLFVIFCFAAATYTSSGWAVFAFLPAAVFKPHSLFFSAFCFLLWRFVSITSFSAFLFCFWRYDTTWKYAARWPSRFDLSLGRILGWLAELMNGYDHDCNDDLEHYDIYGMSAYDEPVVGCLEMDGVGY